VNTAGRHNSAMPRWCQRMSSQLSAHSVDKCELIDDAERRGERAAAVRSY
jgi:hypothetical protein